MDCRLRGRSHLREARRALLRVACAMTRAGACWSSWLSVESRRVALATIATPSRADAPRRRPVAAVRHATAAEAPAPPIGRADRRPGQQWQVQRASCRRATVRASFAAHDAHAHAHDVVVVVEFVVEISRCRAPLRSTSLYNGGSSSRGGCRALQLYIALQRSRALYISTDSRPSPSK